MSLVFVDMKSEGAAVPAVVQMHCFAAWALEKRDLSYTGLAAEFRRALPQAWAGQAYPGYRAADRLVQKLRKHGWLEHRGGGKWALTDKGRSGAESIRKELP